jgi:hypothetical protein
MSDRPIAWVIYLNDETGTPLFFEDDGITKPWETLEKYLGKAIPLYARRECEVS